MNGLDYFEVDNISLTAAIASRIATITLIDSDVNVVGNNQRAQALNDILQEMENTQLKTAIEVALGTGDCLIKPYTDGKDIGYTLIGMHLKDVAVPLRLSVKKIGQAGINAAYTRPKLIGGVRAHYPE